MAKVALQEGFYYNRLKGEVTKAVEALREKALGMESSCAGMKKFESIRNELSNIERGIPINGTTWLCNAIVRTGGIMYELSLLEFSRQKKD